MTSLNFKQYGNENDPCLLFIHGGGVSSWMWDKQIHFFKNNFNCITVDLPEHGLQQDGEIFTIAESANNIIQFIEQMKIKKPITVIGFSLGAQVLLQMLARRPNLIDYAMINSALVRPSKLLSTSIRPLVQLTFPLIKMQSFAKLQAKSLFIGPDHFDTYFKESSQMKQDALIRILQENMSFQLPNHIDTGKTNILVTVGDKEKGIMKKSVLDLLKRLPNSKGVIIAGAGHGVPLAKPDLFNQLMLGWLQDEQLPAPCEIIEIE